MDAKRYRLFDLPLNALTMNETLIWIDEVVRERSEPKQGTALSATKVIKARRNRFLKQSIEDSHLVHVDGQGVVWAAKLLQVAVPERVTGIDLMWQLVAAAPDKGYRLYFLGAREEILESLLARIRNEFPKAIIAGSHHGYFSETEEKDIANDIAMSKADILFVAIPTPHKEQFIHRYLNIMKVPFSMGVGGSFDVLSGKIRRAPRWMQRYGLEWFFRLLQEPHRLFFRYTVNNPLFIWLVLKTYVQQKVFGRGS